MNYYPHGTRGKNPGSPQLRKSQHPRRSALRTTVPASHEELAAYDDQTKHAEAAFSAGQETVPRIGLSTGDEHLHKSCLPQIVDRWGGCLTRSANRLMPVELEAVD
jgi:hypothetical protein